MTRPSSLTWLVLYYNCNANKIMEYDILKYMTPFIKKLKKQAKGDKAFFEDKLDRELMYYFWSKSEWELILRQEDDQIFLYPWVGCRNPEAAKVDVTTATSFDWSGFAGWLAVHRYHTEEGIKFDVYNQVRYRWQEFVDYCWSTRLKYERAFN